MLDFAETVEQIDRGALQRVAEILLDMKGPPGAWTFDGRLSGWPSRRKVANKWFLCCLLDYQIPVERAWGNGLFLAENLLGDPPNLWERIETIPEDDWMDLCVEHSIHRFPQAYTRIRRIGHEMIEHYAGDARLIWDCSEPDVVLGRLMELRVGEQLSRMVVGGLRNAGRIHGRADIKADVHTRRVLGRCFLGRMASAEEATKLARRLHREDPWELDWPLWAIGRESCHATAPDCSECPLRRECAHGE